MNKPISPRTHGVLDYATVGATLLAPRLLGFPDSAARASYALAGSYAALSALTDYPLSVKRAVPFKAHGAAEGLVGLALPALPRLLGFTGHRGARNFFLGLTAVTAVVAALTDWE
ncbi:MAG TPA: hypothetical protein VGV85_07680 [Longimicrobiaceae bacterium]|jgi:hypothetical protein|nr:hypothetical protein [Longimicrobiaceae bacterium]